ncbi:MAG: YqgE/AlgH family protein [Alphaproteobacteria bacterium]
MTDGKDGKSSPAPEQPQQKKPDKPKKTGMDAYIFLALGLLLFMIGGHFNNAPLAGQHKLLVATSLMPDKALQRTVIFMAGHNKTQAYGIVINKPGAKGAPGYGGPLEKDKIYALHSLDVQLPETQVLQDVELGFVEGQAGIDKLKSAKTKPSWYIVVRGYTGWGAGQVEQEIGYGNWEFVEFDKNAVTSTPAAKLWETAKKLPKFQLTH